MTPRPAADDTQNDVMTTRPAADDTQNDVMTTRPAADDTQNDVMTTRPAADDTQNDVMTTRPAADDTQNDVMTTRPTGDDTQNDVEITADRPVADVHQAADEYQCGDFVLINISVGKRGKILEYVGEVSLYGFIYLQIIFMLSCEINVIRKSLQISC